MPSSWSTRFTPHLCAAISVLLLMSGCATPGGDDVGSVPTGPSALAGGKKVGRVSVTRSDLTSDADGLVDEFSILDGLETGIRTELLGKVSPSGSIRVDVEILSLQVRSARSALLSGSEAGTDSMTVQVSVVEGDRAVKTFETGTSTSVGGPLYSGHGVRINRMLKNLSKRIAGGI